MIKYFGAVIFVLSWINSSAQGLCVPPEKKQPLVHGKFFLMWGYNRDWYSKSTITFRNKVTDDYDFTFYNAHASDKPDMQHFYKPDQLTIPQYNLHLGYFFNNKRDLGLELSWDHLKYVMNDYQNIHVKGDIREHQIDRDTLVTPEFVHLQHTNGNNYLMLSVLKKRSMVKYKKVELSVITKVGGGMLISYTISTILGNFDKGYFHYHGYVAATAVDFRMDLGRYFFVQTSLQGAFVNYTNTRLGADHKGLSTQHFYSLQFVYGAGFNVPIGKQ